MSSHTGPEKWQERLQRCPELPGAAGRTNKGSPQGHSQPPTCPTMDTTGYPTMTESCSYPCVLYRLGTIPILVCF